MRAGGARRPRPHRRPRKYVVNAYEVRHGRRDRPCAAYLHLGCHDRSAARMLMFFFLPCCAQAGDPFERAVRLQAIMDGLANVSKSTWRCACPPRAVAAARLLLPAGSRPARPARARACRARCAPAAWLSTAGVCPGWTCRAIFRLGTLSRGPSELRSLILHQRPQRRRCGYKYPDTI